jgi:DNA-binding GntR family transcriptional regulator
MSTTPGHSPPSAPWNHGARRQAIADSLLQEILEGRIPPGGRLVTQVLARRFGVSHTPVREALVMLAGMGLVDLSPNRGAVVRRVTSKDVREICQVRRALECEAVRRACGRIEDEELVGLQTQLQALLDLVEPNLPWAIALAQTIDSRLHDLIAHRSGNVLLVRELTRLNHLFRAFRDLAWNHSRSRQHHHRLMAEACEHMAIVEALLARDRSAAVRAMARHIGSGMRYWCCAISEPAPGPCRTRKQNRINAQSCVEGKIQ